jgi:hypothetical protein
MLSPRTLTLLFRRNPQRDRRQGDIDLDGYEVFWPDGRPVTVSVSAFCWHGQRILGLGRHLAGQGEKLIHLLCYPLHGLEDPPTHLRGCRVRRFFLERSGSHCRLHFMDGTPTAMIFDLAHDEPPVLNWIGLASLREGQRLWVDLSARGIS